MTRLRAFFKPGWVKDFCALLSLTSFIFMIAVWAAIETGAGI